MLYIPKILHYVWLGKKPMHPLMRQWKEKWAALHPEWTVRLWTEGEGLPSHLLVNNGQVLECRNPAYLAACPTYAKRSALCMARSHLENHQNLASIGKVSPPFILTASARGRRPTI